MKELSEHVEQLRGISGERRASDTSLGGCTVPPALQFGTKFEGGIRELSKFKRKSGEHNVEIGELW